VAAAGAAAGAAPALEAAAAAPDEDVAVKGCGWNLHQVPKGCWWGAC
jgi:hypothetical protein